MSDTIAETVALCQLCIAAAAYCPSLGWDVDRDRRQVRGRDPLGRYTVWLHRAKGAYICIIRWHQADVADVTLAAYPSATNLCERRSQADVADVALVAILRIMLEAVS